mgnify:CR=1 FL=1
MSSTAFPPNSRYRCVRRLGEGGTGVVFEAIDEVGGGRVALKTLRESDSNRLYQLKREFRSLVDLGHSHLVRLYELSVSDESAFFTMELIDGVDLLTYCRGESQTGVGEGRVRIAFGQLASGLMALHESGRIHRDVKPSNALVDADGRVVLLDFGLVAELTRLDQETFRENLAGTALYMSPEQARGDELDEASDWYSVGVLLYQVLTGNAPHKGTALEVMQAKQDRDPPRPSTINPSISPELDDLCMALLSRDPAARPRGVDVAATLAPTEPETKSLRLSGGSTSAFTGRDAELAALARSLLLLEGSDDASSRPGAATVLIRGASGIGKTALVRHFVENLDDDASNTVVLEGRCFEREAVPYRAIDGLIDDLSNYWRRLPLADQMYLLPREPAVLQRLFPVLGRVRVVDDATRSSKGTDVTDPQEFRRRAFAGLREVLQRLAAKTRLVLFLDDLQWVDADTISLLTHIFSPPDSPSTLLVMCSRDEETPALDELLRLFGPSVVRHDLGPLSDTDARSLGARLLGPELTALASVVAREAHGNPFFVGALTRYLQRMGGAPAGKVTIDDVLSVWVESLSENARQVLTMLCIAGEPLSQQVVARATKLSPEVAAQELHELVTQHLVRFAATAGSLYEPYHDRVRESIAGALSAPRTSACHQALAVALEALPDGRPIQLARHWHSAGHPEKAAAHAIVGGDQAMAALAFDQAASLYRLALSCLPVGSPDAKGAKEKLALALAHAGRGTEAANHYLELAASSPSPEESLDLRRRAFEQLLVNGHIDRGIESVGPVLATLGMRLSQTPRRATLSLWFQRARLALRGMKYEERKADTVPKSELTKIDVCWSIGVGFAMTDHIRGAEFHTRNLLLALDAGEPHRIAKALAFEGVHLVSVGDTRALDLIRSARALARRLEDPHAIAFSTLMEGVAVYVDGHFTQGLTHCEAARQLLVEQCPGAIWERNTAELYSLWCLGMRGDYPELALRVPRLIQQAQECGNVYTLTNLHTGIPTMRWLVADDPARARAEAVDAMSRWSQGGFHMQHFFELMGLLLTDLYAGSAVSARRDLEARWKTLEASKILYVRFIRINLRYLRACASWEAARELPNERRQLWQEVKQLARSLAKENFPWPIAHANVLEALLAQAAGDVDRADRLLTSAELTFRELGMDGYATAVVRRRGELMGGSEGSRFVAESDAWMKKRGVVRPDRLAALLIPPFA